MLMQIIIALSSFDAFLIWAALTLLAITIIVSIMVLVTMQGVSRDAQKWMEDYWS